MKKKTDTAKLILNVPRKLLEQLDDYAENMNITRTSAVCVLLSQSLGSQKAMNDMGELLKLYQKLEADKKNNKVDVENGK